ncbi:hypothetical protein QJQ45_025802 [Haematococcus lacustris]|nr:hypothetical protein QJQ45_025802 [Haematococcus lacustris]
MASCMNSNGGAPATCAGPQPWEELSQWLAYRPTRSQDMLPQVAEGRVNLPGVVAVSKRVYASPSDTPVSSTHAKAATSPLSSYPDVCFSVHNYEDAFEELVLRHADDCYCVLLHALLPAQCNTDAVAALGSDTAGHSRLVLFSAYVVHRAVQEHLQAMQQQDQHTRPVLPRLLAAMVKAVAGAARKPDSRQAGVPAGQQGMQCTMNGPGGVGRAEVAVTVMPQAAGSEQGGSSWDSEQGTMSLRCALMTLRLPVHVVADNILSAV